MSARRTVTAVTVVVACGLGMPVAGPAPAEMRTQRLSDLGLPTSDVVAYVHDPVVDGARELYSVPRRGGEPVRSSDALPTGVAVDGTFRFAAPSRRVIYRVAEETAGRPELWSVPADGSAAAVKPNPPLAAGGGVYDSVQRLPAARESSLRAR